MGPIAAGWISATRGSSLRPPRPRWSRRLARFVLRRSSFALAGNRLRPFPSAPPRTVLATFAAHGSPVAGVSRGRVGVPPSRPDTTIAEPHPRHLASLTPYRSGPPAPLRHVAGSPGRRLLRGLRRPRARAP